MEKRFKTDNLQAVTGSRQFDPSCLDDPAALATDWEPLNSRTALRVRKLVKLESFRFEFRITAAMLAFILATIIIGLAVILMVFIPVIADKENPASITALLPALLGIPFVVVAGVMLYFLSEPIVFDRYTGYFWRGRENPMDAAEPNQQKYCAAFTDIYALQLLTRYNRAGKRSGCRYELNLVLNDSSRLNIISHGNIAKLRKDAAVLADFLIKPVWDSTSAI